MLVLAPPSSGGGRLRGRLFWFEELLPLLALAGVLLLLPGRRRVLLGELRCLALLLLGRPALFVLEPVGLVDRARFGLRRHAADDGGDDDRREVLEHLVQRDGSR